MEEQKGFVVPFIFLFNLFVFTSIEINGFLTLWLPCVDTVEVIPIRGSLWLATTRYVVCIRGDGDRFMRAVAKNGKPDYKGNDFCILYSCYYFTMIDSFQLVLLLLDS